MCMGVGRANNALVYYSRSFELCGAEGVPTYLLHLSLVAAAAVAAAPLRSRALSAGVSAQACPPGCACRQNVCQLSAACLDSTSKCTQCISSITLQAHTASGLLYNLLNQSPPRSITQISHLGETRVTRVTRVTSGLYKRIAKQPAGGSANGREAKAFYTSSGR